MGDFSAGDELFDEAGRTCKVSIAHPREIVEEYVLVFSDGARISACADHQWVTWTHAERKAFLRSPYEDPARFPENWPTWRLRRFMGADGLSRETIVAALALSATGMSGRKIAAQLGVTRQALAKHLNAGKYVERGPAVYADSPGPRIRTTAQILDTLTCGARGDTNHCIPCAGPLDLPDVRLPIEPYALGYWLANGSSKARDVWGNLADADEFVARVACYIVRADPRGAKTFMARSEVLSGAPKLCPDKKLPPIYLRGSISQRRALLAGLMDGDGYAGGEKSTVEFCNTREHLADAVFELAASLGQKPVKAEGRAMLNGKDCGPKWRVTWRPTENPFSMPRKRDAVNLIGGAQSLRNHHRMVISIERTGRQVPMRCLTVDSPNSMYLAGRSMIPTHNTRTAAEAIRARIDSGRAREIALIGPSKEATRKIMVEGASGILNCYPPHQRPIFEPTNSRLLFQTGAVAHIYTAEEPEKLRGPNVDVAWLDELCAWPNMSNTYDMLQMCLRVAGPKGDPPQELITTTPKPSPLLRSIMDNKMTVVTSGSTFDNAANLDEATLKYLVDKYEGTSLGRQELHGEVLDAFEGALWSPSMLDRNRRMQPRWELRQSPNFGGWHLANLEDGEIVYFKRIVVAVDPAGSANRKSNETGIVVAALGEDEHGYVLQDLSGVYAPEKWAGIAVDAVETWGADMIIAEDNYGGMMVKSTIMAAGARVRVKTISASKGKRVRAEPVALLYEQNRVHHVGVLKKLEEQLCTWDPYGNADSPDRLDSCVAGDSLVETASGPRRIDEIKAGELVLTRKGYRQVLAQRMTQPAAKVIRVETEIGALLATPDHLVYVAEKGWIRVDEVMCGDSLISWTNETSPKSFSIEESSFVAFRTALPAQAASTTRHSIGAGASKALLNCMSRFGETITIVGQFLLATSSTIATTIPSITRPAISFASGGSTMRPSTGPRSRPAFSRRNIWRTSKRSDLWPRNGIERRRDALGIDSTRSASLQAVCRWIWSASVAISRFNPSRRTPDSVPAPARGDFSTALIDIRSPSTAQSVERNSDRISIDRRPRLAPARVVGLFAETERVPVYDLMVEGEHEFFANGILVHNCVWAITEMMVRRPGMFQERRYGRARTIALYAR